MIEIEIYGKTLSETIKKSIEKLSSRIGCETPENLSKKEISVQCRNIEVCIKRILRNILFLAKKEKISNFKIGEIHIIPTNGKWKIRISIDSKICRQVKLKIFRIDKVNLIETAKGWKLKISVILF